MEIGITVRNMGPQSEPALFSACVACAEAAGLESFWITDHLAIPPDDAEGSEGRYLDPLVTLAYAAGTTSRIKLGTGVLILPYRPALPTAKQVATLQELSGERLLLGVGIGWMGAEFRALGIDRKDRGRLSDEVLALLKECFEQDVVTANGQPFLARPRPAAPPVYVGGAAPHALKRAVRHDAGWIPMGLSPEELAAPLEEYRALAAEAGRPPRGVTLLRGLPLADPDATRTLLDAYAALGVERLVCGVRYDALEEFEQSVTALAAHSA